MSGTLRVSRASFASLRDIRPKLSFVHDPVFAIRIPTNQTHYGVICFTREISPGVSMRRCDLNLTLANNDNKIFSEGRLPSLLSSRFFVVPCLLRSPLLFRMSSYIDGALVKQMIPNLMNTMPVGFRRLMKVLI